MPAHARGRPLKCWRYVGIFGPELMICLAAVRVGPARQSFWAVWDRRGRRLYERTTRGRGGVRLMPGRVVLDGAGAGAGAGVALALSLSLDETPGIETVCPTGGSYAWTRKQGGVRARGTVTIGSQAPIVIDARAVIDDTAGYYARHTHWRWCAGVGASADGRELAWNLVDGVNDPPTASERTIWVDGVPGEAPPVVIDAALTGAGELRFAAETVRERRDNLLLVRSRYRQPFGTFRGRLPGGVQLAHGFGVMEEHDAWW